uniref:Uncharacterized protein n=1 Tax=Pararge aegeria TaxID=116150 RepID=S4NR40_9NEOP
MVAQDAAGRYPLYCLSRLGRGDDNCILNCRHTTLDLAHLVRIESYWIRTGDRAVVLVTMYTLLSNYTHIRSVTILMSFRWRVCRYPRDTLLTFI